MKQLVYLAGPYTSDPIGNTRRAIQKADELTERGYDVLVPHLTMLWDFMNSRPAQFWYDLDLNLLSRCDILFRMKGESAGADKEVEFAYENNITVIFEGKEL
jgi:nucleoside 2-deoxyribosyltransferase